MEEALKQEAAALGVAEKIRFSWIFKAAGGSKPDETRQLHVFIKQLSGRLGCSSQ